MFMLASKSRQRKCSLSFLRSQEENSMWFVFCAVASIVESLQMSFPRTVVIRKVYALNPEKFNVRHAHVHAWLHLMGLCGQ